MKQEIFFKKIFSIVTLVICSFMMPCFSSAEESLSAKVSPAELPELPYAFSVKWDISKEDNLLVQDFIVNKRDPFSLFHFVLAPIDQFQTKAHKYCVCIRFESINDKPLGSEEWEQLQDFVGNGAYDAHTGQLESSGVTIPVTIKIEKIDGSHIEVIEPEKMINTTNTAGYAPTIFYDRTIDEVALSEGRYRISIKASHAVKLPPHIETFLSFNTRVK